MAKNTINLNVNITGVEDIRKLIDELQAKLAEEEPAVEPLKEATLSVGDYAKIIGKDVTRSERGSHAFEIGEIVKVVNVGIAVTCEKLEGDTPHNQHVSLGDVTRATDAEVAEAKAKMAEAKLAEKWAKVGRKPGEIKEGDIVKVVEAVGDLPVGTFGEVGDSNGSSFRVNTSEVKPANWHFPEVVELITPVEARFDRA